MGLMPYWVSQYVPIPFAYHYYSFVLSSGLYVAYHFNNGIMYLVCFILSSLMSIVCGSIYFSEVSNAGSTYVLGERNYSHIAGSRVSLNVTTFNSDSTFSDAMAILDICNVSMAFIMTFVNLLYGTLLYAAKKYNKCDCTEIKLRQMTSRDWVSVLATLGILIVVYYIVASIIMVTDSVVIISPIASPNTLAVFLIGVSVRLPRLRVSESKVVSCLSSTSMFIHFVLVAWLLSISFSISSMVMIINWRAVQDNYTSGKSMCPSREIIQALNANYTFTFPWNGIDELTYSNRSSWTPETFADFTCADDALNLVMCVFGLIMFILTMVYVCFWYRDMKLQYISRNEHQPLVESP